MVHKAAELGVNVCIPLITGSRLKRSSVRITDIQVVVYVCLSLLLKAQIPFLNPQVPNLSKLKNN
jgi:hypothetical protein